MRRAWIFLALPVVAMAAGWVLAATVKNSRNSYYSNLEGPVCQDTDAQGSFRCAGLGSWGASGWYVDINDEGNIITTAIAQYDSKAEALTLMGRGLGEKAEWRGNGTGRYFKADSVIVRMRPVEDDAQISSFLFVSRLQPKGACLIAIVDAKANKDANILARNAADNMAMKCGKAAVVMGIKTEATTAFVNSNNNAE